MTQQIRSALLSCWLGVMVFFSFVVAPVVFRVLPTQHLAGIPTTDRKTPRPRFPPDEVEPATKS